MTCMVEVGKVGRYTEYGVVDLIYLVRTRDWGIHPELVGVPAAIGGAA